MTGKVAPDMVKPAPVRDAESMVSGAVPEDVSVTDCGADVLFTVTLPKFRLAELNCNAGDPDDAGTFALRLIV